MAKLRLACIQMPVALAQVQKNLAIIERHLQVLDANEVDIIGLPELWTTEFSFRDTEELAKESQTGQKQLLKHAKRLKVQFIGSILAGNGPFFNVSESYRKIHLFTPGNEERFYQPGNSLEVIRTGPALSGLSICYDLRFPEVFRALSLMGAQIIWVPAAWPATRRDHWITLLRARAIENQVFMVGINRIGKSSEGFSYAGHSMIIDPWGETLWDGGPDKEGMGVVEIDLDFISNVRKKIPVWQDARPDLYQEWIKLWSRKSSF